jgi:hypothetical protein
VGSAAGSDRRGAGDSALVVCLERTDTPVRILEDFRVLSDILLARAHAVQALVHRATRLSVDIASPVTAEGVAEDEALIQEALLDVTVALVPLEASGRLAKGGCIRLVREQTVGLATTREEPDLDALSLPLGDVVTTVDRVETLAERATPCIGHTAASRLRWAVECAVVQGLSTGLSHAVDLALSIGMEYEVVVRVLVDTLDDIDLSLDGPWLATEGPEGRPGATDATRHVLDIKDEETLVVLLDTLKTNTLATNIASIRTV